MPQPAAPAGLQPRRNMLRSPARVPPPQPPPEVRAAAVQQAPGAAAAAAGAEGGAYAGDYELPPDDEGYMSPEEPQ